MSCPYHLQSKNNSECTGFYDNDIIIKVPSCFFSFNAHINNFIIITFDLELENRGIGVNTLKEPVIL